MITNTVTDNWINNPLNANKNSYYKEITLDLSNPNNRTARISKNLKLNVSPIKSSAYLLDIDDSKYLMTMTEDINAKSYINIYDYESEILVWSYEYIVSSPYIYRSTPFAINQSDNLAKFNQSAINFV